MGTHLATAPREHHHPYLLASIVTIGMLPARSAAQPTTPDPDDDDPGASSASAEIWELAPTTHGGERDPTVATALSVGVTAAAALAAAVSLTDESTDVPTGALVGLAVGPTLGHWYGGRAWTRSTSLRVGGLVIGSAGLAVVAGCVDGRRDLPCELGDDALLGGSLLYVAATVYEIMTAPRSAADRRPGQPPATRLVVTSLHGNDRIVPGVAMRIAF